MKIKFIQDIIDLFRHKIPNLAVLVSKKYAYEKLNPKTIHTIILGSSHIYNGYLPQKGEFNLAAPSQDAYYTYNMYKHFNTEFVKNVIVSFSVFSTGSDLIKTNFAKFCILYKLLFNIEYQNENDAAQKDLYKYENKYKKEIKRYLKHLKTDLMNYRGETLKYPAAKFDRKKTKETALKHLKNNQRPIDQMEYFKALIKDTQSNNQKLTFVLPPAVKEYRNYLPNKSELFKKLYQAVEGYSHVKILDFYDSELFDMNDFCDCHHLNKQGAVKFTEQIKKDM